MVHSIQSLNKCAEKFIRQSILNNTWNHIEIETAMHALELFRSVVSFTNNNNAQFAFYQRKKTDALRCMFRFLSLAIFACLSTALFIVVRTWICESIRISIGVWPNHLFFIHLCILYIRTCWCSCTIQNEWEKKQQRNPLAITETNHMGEKIATEKWQNRILSRIYENYFPSIDFKLFKPEYFSFQKDRPLRYKSSKCFHTNTRTLTHVAVCVCMLVRVRYVVLLVSLVLFPLFYLCLSVSLLRPSLVNFWIARGQLFKMTILFEFLDVEHPLHILLV